MSCESRHGETRKSELNASAQGNSSRRRAKNALQASLARLTQGQMPTVIELMSILSNVSDYTYVANDTEDDS